MTFPNAEAWTFFSAAMSLLFLVRLADVLARRARVRPCPLYASDGPFARQPRQPVPA